MQICSSFWALECRNLFIVKPTSLSIFNVSFRDILEKYHLANVLCLPDTCSHLHPIPLDLQGPHFPWTLTFPSPIWLQDFHITIFLFGVPIFAIHCFFFFEVYIFLPWKHGFSLPDAQHSDTNLCSWNKLEAYYSKKWLKYVKVRKKGNGRDCEHVGRIQPQVLKSLDTKYVEFVLFAWRINKN